MPLKTFSALSSTTSFFLPLGILNSPQNLSKLKGSLHNVQFVQTVPAIQVVRVGSNDLNVLNGLNDLNRMKGITYDKQTSHYFGTTGPSPLPCDDRRQGWNRRL